MAPQRPDFEFYSRPQYYQELLRRINATGKGSRVFMATMAFHPEEPPVAEITDALCAAARRGATVHLMVDAFIFLISEGARPGPMFFSRQAPAHPHGIFKKRLAALQELRRSGGTYTVTNPPRRAFTNPYAGRSHIKFSVIDNYVFVGGCNLSQIDNLDLMAGWEDKTIANWLCDYSQKAGASDGSVINALGKKDLRLAVGGATDLLVDVGKPNQSVILSTALSLIDQAQKSITITCQFFPNDITARHLAQAVGRGVDVKVIYNHPSQHPFPLNFLHYGVVVAEKRRKPEMLFRHQLPRSHARIHAKLLATDQGTLVGSHNYVRAGVGFGTAEIALFSRNEDFGRRATRAIEQQLKP